MTSPPLGPQPVGMPGTSPRGGVQEESLTDRSQQLEEVSFLYTGVGPAPGTVESNTRLA